MNEPAAQIPAEVARTPQPVQDIMRGSAWMIAARWAMRLIGLVSTVILARLLAPEDFGLVAIALLAYGLVETISYAGVDLALIRPGRDTRAHYDTAWTVQVLQGVFMAVCLGVAAPFLASYFNEPRALAVTWWMALRAPIDALSNIGVVAFRKELDFAKEFRYTLVNKLLGFAAVVGAALWFRSYWALVLGSLVGSCLGVILSYRMHPYRPRLSLARFEDIWAFSQWLMISRLGSYLNRKCDELVVGSFAGAAMMGSYHVANGVATLPSSEIVMPVRRAMFPALAKASSSEPEYTRAVLSSLAGVATFCLFIACALAVVASDFAGLILGSKWPEAAPLMRWLAIFGGLSALVLVLEVPLWVAGRTQVSAAQSWAELALIAPVCYLAAQSWGAEGVAVGRAAVALMALPLMMGLVARTGIVGFWPLAGALWRPAAAAAGMAAIVTWLPVHRIDVALLRLLAAGAACTLAYFGLLLLLWRVSGRPAGPEQTMLYLIRRTWRRETASTATRSS